LGEFFKQKGQFETLGLKGREAISQRSVQKSDHPHVIKICFSNPASGTKFTQLWRQVLCFPISLNCQSCLYLIP